MTVFLDTKSKFLLYNASVVGKPSMSFTSPSFVVIVMLGNERNMAITNCVIFLGVEILVVFDLVFFYIKL